MKKVLLFFSVTVIGLALGYFGTWYAIAVTNPASKMLKIGNWYTQEHAGSPEASSWDRAFVAYHATFAVQSSEIMYLVRKRDDDGNQLTEKCTYEITGREIPAHWWSITIYDAEGFHPKNKFESSVDSETMKITPGEFWRILLSNERPEGHWIPSIHAGEYNLVLRLYAPRVKLRELKNLPAIRRLACRA